MKKNLFIIIALMATSVSYAQSIRVYNWDFKNGSEAEVGKIFEQYFDRERNSGSAILQIGVQKKRPAMLNGMRF
jgi:hypothetical protein